MCAASSSSIVNISTIYPRVLYTTNLPIGTSALESLSFMEHDDELRTVDEILQTSIDKIADQISLLYKLSNTIRRASKEVQNSVAATSFRIRDEEGNDIEDFLRTSYTYYVRDRFPATDLDLQQRLASTMILRRKRILYRRSRYGNNPIRIDNTRSQQPVMPLYRAEAVANEAGQSKSLKRKSPSEGSLMQSNVKSNTRSATTLAPSTFQKATAPSVVSATKTVALSSHEALSFPPAPISGIRINYERLKQQRKDANPDRISERLGMNKPAKSEWDEAVDSVGEIVCPYCFYALPARDVVNESKWK